MEDELNQFLHEIEQIDREEQRRRDVDAESVASKNVRRPIAFMKAGVLNPQDTMGSRPAPPAATSPAPPPPPDAGAVLLEPRSVWQHCLDERTGFYYYWNTQSNCVQWTIPPEYSQFLLRKTAFDERKAVMEAQNQAYTVQIEWLTSPSDSQTVASNVQAAAPASLADQRAPTDASGHVEAAAVRALCAYDSPSESSRSERSASGERSPAATPVQPAPADQPTTIKLKTPKSHNNDDTDAGGQRHTWRAHKKHHKSCPSEHAPTSAVASDLSPERKKHKRSKLRNADDDKRRNTHADRSKRRDRHRHKHRHSSSPSHKSRAASARRSPSNGVAEARAGETAVSPGDADGASRELWSEVGQATPTPRVLSPAVAASPVVYATPPLLISSTVPDTALLKALLNELTAKLRLLADQSLPVLDTLMHDLNSCLFALQLRSEDWLAGALDSGYFHERLCEMRKQVAHIESKLCPPNWTVIWCSDKQVCLFKNTISGRTQHQLPISGDNGFEDSYCDMDIDTGDSELSDSDSTPGQANKSKHFATANASSLISNRGPGLINTNGQSASQPPIVQAAEIRYSSQSALSPTDCDQPLVARQIDNAISLANAAVATNGQPSGTTPAPIEIAVTPPAAPAAAPLPPLLLETTKKKKKDKNKQSDPKFNSLVAQWAKRREEMVEEMQEQDRRRITLKNKMELKLKSLVPPSAAADNSPDERPDANAAIGQR